MSALCNFYWFRIDTKHMTEPWLGQALMDSAYSSVLEQSYNFKCSMKQKTQQLYSWKLKPTHFTKYLVSSKTFAMSQHQKQLFCLEKKKQLKKRSEWLGKVGIEQNIFFLQQLNNQTSIYHHSCIPSSLAPDPIRVQSCVWCLFWTNRSCMVVTSIFLSIFLSN